MAKKKVKEERITTIYTYSYLGDIWGDCDADIKGGTIKVVVTPEMYPEFSRGGHAYLLQRVLAKIEQQLARKNEELGALLNLTLLSTELKREAQEVL